MNLLTHILSELVTVMTLNYKEKAYNISKSKGGGKQTMLYLTISILDLLSGFVPANQEVWVLGDGFLTMAAQHLEYWKEIAKRDPHEALYMLHWYDIKLIVPQAATSNSVELITGALVNMMNTRPKLPSILVIMLGDVKFWCENSALKFTMDLILKSLVKEIKRIVQLRQRDLPDKAVGPDPIIYFVKLHWKPDKAIDGVAGYPKKRRTFNKLLDSIMRPRGVKTIALNEITTKVDKDFFLNHGSLSQLGYRQVWKSLSEALDDFNNLGYQRQIDFVMNTKPNLKEVVSSNESDDDGPPMEDENLNFHNFNMPHHRPNKPSAKKKNIRGKSKFHNPGHWNFF